MTKVICMMGVSGSGKSHVGELLARELSIPFYDADDFHLESSIQKMRSGIPLVDENRWPWLDRLNQLAKENADQGCVIACSALKKEYRDRLAQSMETELKWVYLKGGYEQIASRMENRKGHYMKAEMLRSQFDILDEPIDALVIDISQSPVEIVERIKTNLK